MELKTNKGIYSIDYNGRLDIATIFDISVEHDQPFKYVGYWHIGGEERINDIDNIKAYMKSIEEYENKDPLNEIYIKMWIVTQKLEELYYIEDNEGFLSDEENKEYLKLMKEKKELEKEMD